MRHVWVGLSTMILLACATPANDGDVTQAGTPNDRAAVQAAIDTAIGRFTEGMIKGDTAAIMSAYADDAMVLPSGLPLARGRAEIARLNQGMLNGMSVPAFKITTTDLLVTGDYAIETGTFAMTMKPKTGAAIDEVGKYVAVWQKQGDGSWKMIRDIWNSDKATH